jgi:hypothetical protein
LIEFLSQLNVLLKCFPSQSPDVSTVNSPLPVSDIADLLACSQDSLLWRNTYESVTADLEKLISLKDKVKNMLVRKFDWISKEDIELVKVLDEAMLETNNRTLSKLRKAVTKMDSGKGNCLVKPIDYLASQITAVSLGFNNWLTDKVSSLPTKMKPDVVDDISQQCEKVVTQVLLAVQNLMKLHESRSHSHADDEELVEADTENEEEDGGLEDHHLSERLIKDITDHVQCMKIEEVTNLYYRHKLVMKEKLHVEIFCFTFSNFLLSSSDDFDGKFSLFNIKKVQLSQYYTLIILSGYFLKKNYNNIEC